MDKDDDVHIKAKIANAFLSSDSALEAIELWLKANTYEEKFTRDLLDSWWEKKPKYRSDTIKFITAFTEKVRNGETPPDYWMGYACHILRQAVIATVGSQGARNSEIAIAMGLSGRRDREWEMFISVIVHMTRNNYKGKGTAGWACDIVATRWAELSKDNKLYNAPEWLSGKPISKSYLEKIYSRQNKGQLEEIMLVIDESPEESNKWINLFR